MYLRLPKILHLELTSYCNASCPLCLRTTLTNPTSLPASIIKAACDGVRFDKVIYCGNDGDPLMARDLEDCLDYFSHTSQVIHTNGSLRPNSFWKHLGSVPNLEVVFAIDGADPHTHAKYRVGTDFDFILSNAREFNRAGGNSVWQFIVFEHNIHQIDQARALAKQNGFSQFELRYSRRPDVGEIKAIRVYKNKPTDSIVCMAAQQQKIYVRADGEVFPCVYQGERGNDTGLNIYDRRLCDIVFDPYFDSFNFNNPICLTNCKEGIRNHHERTSF